MRPDRPDATTSCRTPGGRPPGRPSSRPKAEFPGPADAAPVTGLTHVMLQQPADKAADAAAWRLAVRRVPAAVPEFVGARLRRLGEHADWCYSGRWTS
jgi:hypothetical protein